MKKSSTLFLKFVIFLIAAIVLVGMLWFPKTEGRAQNLDLISIYTDPFIIYLYIASIPFFGALFQAFKLLGFIEANKAFSQISVNALRNIKYCAIALMGFITCALVYIFLVHSESDDPAGAVAMGVVIIFASAVIATAAAVFQRLLQNAVDIKAENDLTV